MKRITLFFLFALLTSLAAAQPEASNYATWLKAEVRGQGPDLVFIPGYGCQGAVWAGTVQALQDRYTCHVLTLQQFAGELEPDTALLKGTLAALHAYCEVETERPTLVGHSLGGFLALALASERPEAYGALVSVDALPYLAAAWAPQPQQMAPARLAQQYAAMDSATFFQAAWQAARGMVSDTAEARRIAHWSDNADRSAYGYLFAEFFNTDLRDSLDAITCPALLMVAQGQGEAQTLPVWEEQYAALARQQTVYHPEARHFLMLDDPNSFLDHLEKFLAHHATAR